MAQTDTTFLNALQSEEQQKLLDEIDNLRLAGVSEFVFLPQIIVCGDQSSGKSSVLEAVSSVPFPRSDTLCTRFATEVVLRQGPNVTVDVSIVPNKDALEPDRKRLQAFKESLGGLDELPDVMEKAKSEMGLLNTRKSFSRDILRVEICGPNQPKLTVVDLPGLIHAVEDQDPDSAEDEDVQLITDLVHGYMVNPRSVILAVVSAKNDYNNQIILKRARNIDPKGLRTLGLITKPDDPPEGSESEMAFFDLAQNHKIRFRLGWHVLKNRDYKERHCSTQERDEIERKFFSERIWKKLPREMVGVDSLRGRLSKILLDQIKMYLPTLTADIQTNLQECKDKLDRLGKSRDTSLKQFQFLLELSQSFQNLCRAAIDGNYNYPFFGSSAIDDEYRKRIRTVVQNRNLEFAESMRERGHRWAIVDDPEEPEDPDEEFDDNSCPYNPRVKSRASAIRWIRSLLARSRGRELPGSFNPLLVGELFSEQSVRWGDIARDHIKEMWLESKLFLEKVCSAIADEETATALFTYWIDPITDERIEKANKALDRLLADRDRHPITYNHYYTETLQDLRAERQIKELQRSIQGFLGVSSDTTYVKSGIRIDELAKSLSKRSSDMDEFACSELLDSMQAYYKVALKTFIDNVAIQVVEALLIGDLWSIFSPSDVGKMSPDVISSITAESTESQALRKQLEQQLVILEKGIVICRRSNKNKSYIKHLISYLFPTQPDQKLEELEKLP
ncbi:hypothetical protein ASPWEDRAFT_51601 [Aspergillus wentii DTO 134E9]|uniref:GED domain-containing protein n=1 Tax=Aspergillus wentii DTO 134E9 TaxID=1073089 RepID=A0A1L9RL91_ASPWE|nr:uncharacterized protein ASPWEDRAFT_51601 [Aspergillus wentii DTO 134E9]OJJ35598.1 hypothetical protein ASPWEDRAFT_51601 [Aspergillus wentii DTO 134E9]